VNEFCSSPKYSADFDFLYDCNKSAPVVDSVSHPTMPSGHIADVDAAMSKGNGMPIVVIDNFASEFDRVARSDLLVYKAAAIHSFRRFVSEFFYPTWIGLHAVFRNQGEGVRPLLSLSGLR